VNKLSYQYSVFGLNVASEIELTNLTECTFTLADVIIKLDQVSLHLPNAFKKNQFEQISTEDYLLDVPNIARYYVKSGKLIFIEKSDQATNLEIQSYLLGTVFANILHYHNYLVLHGSAILVNDQAVVFSGHSGAGKSTLAAAFMKRGYQVLTDDIVVLSPNRFSGFSLIPGPPKLKLWQLSVDNLKISIKNANKIARKYEIPITQDQRYSVTINSFYELNKHGLDNVQINSVLGMDKLVLLMTHTFRYYMLGHMGKLAGHLKFCSRLSQQIKLFKVYRPENEFVIDELVATIERDFIMPDAFT
jgi:hypothetical protein